MMCRTVNVLVEILVPGEGSLIVQGDKGVESGVLDKSMRCN
jgi:hypothetical protein